MESQTRLPRAGDSRGVRLQERLPGVADAVFGGFSWVHNPQLAAALAALGALAVGLVLYAISRYGASAARSSHSVE